MSLKERREHAGTHLLPGPKVIKLMRSFQKRLNLPTDFQKHEKSLEMALIPILNIIKDSKGETDRTQFYNALVILFGTVIFYKIH